MQLPVEGAVSARHERTAETAGRQPAVAVWSTGAAALAAATMRLDARLWPGCVSGVSLGCCLALTPASSSGRTGQAPQKKRAFAIKSSRVAPTRLWAEARSVAASAVGVRLDLHAEVGERADGERRALPGEPRDDTRVLEGANPVVDPLDLLPVCDL